MDTTRKMFRLPRITLDYLESKMAEWGGEDGPMEQSDALQRVIDEHSTIPGLYIELTERCARLLAENKRIVAICEQHGVIIREDWS